MTTMIETEGAFVPKEKDSRGEYDVFNLSLWGGDLEFSLNVPMYFETDFGVYNSAGVFYVSMKDVFEEYLNGIKKIDAGFNYKELTSYLRDYADRVDAVMEEENTNDNT